MKATDDSFEVSVPKGKEFKILIVPAGSGSATVTIKANSV